jgi:protoporphyrin/coproporphyrin ferrochelatase
MSRYSAAEVFSHDAPARTAVLLVQLGTPAAPEAGAVRRYLKQFLWDPRVVEIPRALWWALLHGIVLNTRPKRSARKYASIWTREGSPLLVNTVKQAALVRGYLGEAGHDAEVEFAMRYGEPSIESVLRKLRERNLTRLLVLPLYPQYAASTTASALDAVFSELMRWRNPPELRTIRDFHDDPDYIEALAGQVRSSWQHDGPPERLLMSFHGLPRRSLSLGDPYHCECLATGRLLAERLGLSQADYQVTFQSRFGAAEWLQPYTDATLTRLAARGVRRVDLICPGFVSDCLETLEEIAIEARQKFIQAGGTDFRYIACLNDSPALIRALVRLIDRHLAGWPTQRAASPEASREQQAARDQRKQRAQALGAPN